ncbi:MAG: NAD(P)H-dependent oxidoreductase [Patescibacteria group bacterium]|nr:NAD(P)H-dependent oxidoreductase [Patescibacteria group bacterium]
MNNKTLNIKVIAGSTREGRFSDKAAVWIAEEIKTQNEVVVEVLDLRDYNMPFFNEPVSPSFKQEPFKDEAVARFTKKIAEADAFVIVTPEYNHGTSGVLKNALDWVYPEWNNKPVAFVSYGGVGGARAVEQLRLNAVELQMAPIRAAVHIPGEQYFQVLFGKMDAKDLFALVSKQSEAMISQLLWWTRALKNAREQKQ